ncbi:MAG: SAM-dependent methyltransferase [Cellulomonas sp.]|uniref:N-6 DNA methylase n=1 Tax=Cellulomonas sp. TaxID=40001 RepID=UPI00258A92CD|nr:N-6 DNA methylase [Cellulomonas sp.]MCR6703179.1 SAM-dependent methyltransferase [Cellulomonas sp.]
MVAGRCRHRSAAKGDIRARIVEADLVSCMVALPTRCSAPAAGIPVCVWTWHQDKTAGARGAVSREGEVLFIDARDLELATWSTAPSVRCPTRTSPASPTRPRVARHPVGRRGRADHDDVPGFCRTVPLAEIKEADCVLTPGRYV